METVAIAFSNAQLDGHVPHAKPSEKQSLLELVCLEQIKVSNVLPRFQQFE